MQFLTDFDVYGCVIVSFVFCFFLKLIHSLVALTLSLDNLIENAGWDLLFFFKSFLTMLVVRNV